MKPVRGARVGGILHPFKIIVMTAPIGIISVFPSLRFISNTWPVPIAVETYKESGEGERAPGDPAIYKV